MTNPSTVTVTAVETEQDFENETTIYWFNLDGTDYGTGYEFDDDVFGIAESGNEDSILNCYGIPLTDGDNMTIAVRNNVTITEKMRMDAAGNAGKWFAAGQTEVLDHITR